MILHNPQMRTLHQRDWMQNILRDSGEYEVKRADPEITNPYQHGTGVLKEGSRIGHSMARPVILVVQQNCWGKVLPADGSLPLFVFLVKPETADRRMRIPTGMPEDIGVSAVPRPFRSGR
jgi:hypothetical protein